MNLFQLVIQGLSQDFVLSYDKIKINTNNDWLNGIPPNDYRQNIESNYMSKWINKFRNDYEYIEINDPDELNWMKKAKQVSMLTGKFSELFREELENYLEKYENKYTHIFNGTEYFVRSENVSLKYGKHKEGPYTNLRNIIESILTCIHGHTPLYEDTDTIKLYLFPWIKLDKKKEFRVFVYNKKITAISQQFLHHIVYENNNSKEFKNQIYEYVEIILLYFYQEISNKINLNNYTYDFALLDNNEPYFIEPNSFGPEQAAGSALFGWHNDHDIIYQESENPIVYFRYTF